MVFYLIIGSMFSGKTTRMIELLSKISFRNPDDVCLFRHKKDDRYPGVVATHSGIAFSCQYADSIGAMSDKIAKKPQLRAIGIDEGHFYPAGELREFILNLMCNRPELDIIMTTVQSDYSGNMMECVRILLPIAEEIIQQRGICEKCGTWRAIASKMREKKYDSSGNLLFIGGKDIYSALCVKCFNNFE